ATSCTTLRLVTAGQRHKMAQLAIANYAPRHSVSRTRASVNTAARLSQRNATTPATAAKTAHARRGGWPLRTGRPVRRDCRRRVLLLLRDRCPAGHGGRPPQVM